MEDRRYTRMPKEEAIRAIMKDFGVAELRARFILSIMTGEHPKGDVVQVEDERDG